MADNERVNINIDTDADTSGISKTQRRLAALAAQAQAMGDRMDAVNDRFEKFDRFANRVNEKARKAQRSFSRLTETFSKFKKSQKDVDDAGKKLDKTLNKGFRTGRRYSRFMRRTFVMVMKIAALETLGLVLALSSVNALLATGSALAKAWNSTFKALAVVTANAAAGITAAIALFTAAQRQFQAAQASGSYGGNFAASSRALRMVQTDANLAVFGIQALSGAFASASRNAAVTGQTAKSVSGLADFAVMSGDMEKGLAATANLVTLLQSGKNNRGEQVLAAAKDIGPEFEKAYKEVFKAGAKTNEELLAMFASGDLAKAAGVSGTAQNVRGTLMGQLKTFVTEFQTVTADFGMSFMRPAQELFERLTVIFRRTLLEISSSLYQFGTGNFIDGIVSAAEKLSEFIVVLFEKYLPMTDQFIDNFVSGWRRMTGWFSSTLEKFRLGLRRFSEASRVMNKFLGEVLGGIGRGFRDNFTDLAEWVVANEEKFVNFGRQLGDAFYNVLRIFQDVRMGFLEASPAIMMLVNAFLSLAGVLSYILGLLGKILGGLSAFGSGFGAIGGVFPLMGMLGMGAGFNYLKGTPGGGRSGRMLKGVGRGARGVYRNVGGAGLAATALTIGAYQLFNSMIGPGQSYDSVGSAFASAARDASVAGFLPALLLSGSHFAGYQAGKTAGGGKAGKAIAKGKTAGIRRTLARPTVMASLALATAAGGTSLTNDFVNMAVRNKGLSNQKFLGMRGSTWAGIGTGYWGGAATGAATGAMIGSFFPGAGTLIGAGIGALVGIIFGIASGIINSKKAQNEARDAGRQFTENYASGVEDMLRAGGINQARQALHDFSKNLDEFANNSAFTDLIKEGAMEAAERRLEKAQAHLDVITAHVNDLGEIAGMTQDEVISLAQSLELDLTGNVKDLQTILHETGIAVMRFGEDFNKTFNRMMAEAISEIDTALKMVESPAVINEAARAFREMAESSEGAGAADVANLLRTAAEQALLLSGGDPLLAYQSVLENLGTAGAPGRQFTTPGGVLYGLQGQFFSPEGQFIFDQYMASAKGGLVDIVAQNMISELAGYGMSMNMSQAQAALMGMDDAGFLELAQAYQRGETAFSDTGMGRFRPQSTEDYENALSNFLGAQFEAMTGTQVAVSLSEAERTRQALAAAATEGTKAGILEGLGSPQQPLLAAMNTFNENINKLIEAVGGTPASTTTRGNNSPRTPIDFTDSSNAYNPNFVPDTSDIYANAYTNDTFTPRRNLVDTMSRHRAIDRMISGNRTLTSSLRSFGLGSGMSDHAAGRAYDLVGDNLGLYAAMVNGSGGYAAFHGAGGNRHLHVVPGSGPIGDTAVPRMMPAGAMAGGGPSVSQDTITVNVYASEGMDETALANRVVDRIRNIQRNERERY